MLAATLLLAASLAAQAPVAAPTVPADWEPAPAYVTLFAPRLHRDAYRAYVSPRPLEEIRGNFPGAPPADGQLPLNSTALSAFEAFGRTGAYDRWRLLLLYGPQAAHVARIPQLEQGRVVAALTFISPYPDPAIDRLQPGTLLIVLRMPPL